MGREKRKGRLDKSSGTATAEFIGFSSFSTSTEPEAASAQSTSSTTSTTWSPVYTGSDDTLQLLFTRIAQKRDATTKVKALDELQAFLASKDPSGDDRTLRRTQVEALQHYAWLYYHKMHYDTRPTVRVAALNVWLHAEPRIPKAVQQLLTTVQPELLGMLFVASQTDGKHKIQNEWFQDKSSSSSWPWKRGLVDLYAHRILSYGRPSVLYDALYAKRNNNREKDEKSNETQELEQEKAEEQFERIVGNCLDALSVFVSSNHQSTTDDIEDTALWWKTLSNSKPGLRLKTLRLLMVCCQQKLPIPENVTFVLLHEVSSEREVTNVPVVLNAVAAYVSYLQKERQADDDKISQFIKPLTKVLKKACYGSPAHHWSPTLLPLSALLGNTDPQPVVALLESAWEGRELVLGGDRDRFLLAKALAESASFWLLLGRSVRGDGKNSDWTQAVQSLASVWIDAFEFALSIQPVASRSMPTGVAQNELIDQIVGDLTKFHHASNSKPDSAFGHSIDHNWFWNKAISFSKSDPMTLSLVLRRFDDAAVRRKLLVQVRDRFHAALAPLQASSGAAPSQAAYELFTSALEFFQSQELFTEQFLDVEKFVMNDLLRWMILHTSSLSDVEQIESVVRNDFTVLFYTLQEIPNRTSLWQSLFRELVAAKAKMEWLTLGLRTLTRKSHENNAWIQCDALSSYAKSQGEVASKFQAVKHTDYVNDENPLLHSIEYKQFLDFFYLCVGLSSLGHDELSQDEEPSAIVDQGVIEHWVTCTTIPNTVANYSPLLEALLNIAAGENMKSKSPSLSGEQKHQLMCDAWRIGETRYLDIVRRLLRADAELEQRFLAYASDVLSHDLKNIVVCSKNDRRMTKQWAMAANDLLNFLDNANQSNRELASKLRGIVLFPESEGSNRFALWNTYPKSMFICAKELFSRISEVRKRVSLLGDYFEKQNNDRNKCTIIYILTALQKEHTLSSTSTGVSGTDWAEQFLRMIIGQDGLDREFLLDVVGALVEQISAQIRSESAGASLFVGKQVSCLALVLRFLFRPAIDGSVYQADEIVEGMNLWYISNSEEPSKRTAATVKKVHFDAQAGYYFTVSLNSDSEQQERQTILGRLRKDEGADSDLVQLLADGNPEIERKDTRNLLLSNLIKPCLASSADHLTEPLVMLGATIALLGQVVGFGDGRGLGTPKYDTFLLLQSFDTSLRQALSVKDMQLIIRLCWLVSTCLGYSVDTGFVTKWSHHCFRLDFSKTFDAMYEMYNSGTMPHGLDVRTAVLLWLSTSIEHLIPENEEVSSKSDVMTKVLAMIFGLASIVLESSADSTIKPLTRSVLVGSLAMLEGTKCACRYNQLAIDTERSSLVVSLVLLIKNMCSASIHTLTTSHISASWVLEQILAMPPMMKYISSASSMCRSVLLTSLFEPQKRNLAFRLSLLSGKLDIGAESDENVLSDVISSRLKDWANQVTAEEKEDLEEDLAIVSEWLPVEMMEEFESWTLLDLGEMPEAQTHGQLLMWLLLLNSLEKAASGSFRNRPAFISYLSRCGAFSHIMNLALLNERTINGRKENEGHYDNLLANIPNLGSRNGVSHTSSVVLFRSLEVLPSLARRWWEEDCPKVYIKPMQEFLERFIGPRILKRELSRIKGNPERFGDMNVSSSSISREIKAEYLQDDFTLKVTITLPPAFPFRSAEVDCSKTLGVAQSRWKRWSLQIRQMLNNQGGTLTDALMLWKDNVDKEFDGIEPCPVCYSVLHVKTHKLPALQCKTCSNRFHVDCLTQWFRSSGKSQCVLCQKPWEGTRIV